MLSAFPLISFSLQCFINPLHSYIAGQFWNIPVTVVPYSGEQALPEHFVVTVSPPNRPARRFIAVRFSHNWDNSPGPCMYVGNSQGAPSGEVTDPNDSVIEPLSQLSCGQSPQHSLHVQSVQGRGVSRTIACPLQEYQNVSRQSSLVHWL